MENDILRHNHYQDFSILPNSLVRDERLSFGARGLLCYLLSLPSDWTISVKMISTAHQMTERAVKLLLKELMNCEYCKCTPKWADGHLRGYRYQITDTPGDFAGDTKNDMPAGYTNFVAAEKAGCLKNGGAYKVHTLDKVQSLSNKVQSEERASAPAPETSKEVKGGKFIPPTLEEVRSYCHERNSVVNPEKFFYYYERNGWMVGKAKMKNWHAAIHTWELKEQDFDKASTVSTPTPAPQPKQEAPASPYPQGRTEKEQRDYEDYLAMVKEEERQREEEKKRRASMPFRERMQPARLTR